MSEKSSRLLVMLLQGKWKIV